MGCVLDEAGTYGAECSRKAASERSVACDIRSLVNARDLQLECATVLHETLLALVLMYGNDIICGKRRRDLELELYRWTISEDCYVLEGWIGFRMHG